MESFFQMVVNSLQLGSFYALIALGYSMVYGVLLLFNFAHGDVFMVGAYIGLFIALGLIAIFGTFSLALPGWLVLVLTKIPRAAAYWTMSKNRGCIMGSPKPCRCSSWSRSN